MIFKTGKKIWVYCSLFIVLTACGPDDFIQVTTDIIRDANDANNYIELVYASIVDGSLMPDGFLFMPLLFTDNCYYAALENPDWQEASDMDIKPDNSTNRNIFNDLYTTNEDLAVLFAQLDTTEHESLTEDVKNGFRAEGRAIRAVLYYYLTSYWGNVPLILEDTEEIDSLIPNATDQELFDQIEADLLFADANIAGNSDVNTNQRLGPVAIKAWLARFYLQNERWADALTFAEAVLSSGDAFMEEDVADVYDVNSDEHIWVLPEFSSGTSIAAYFLPDFVGLDAVRPRIDIPFEDGDARRRVALNIPGSNVAKYLDISSSSDPIYLFRYPEIHLIAAEAEIKANGNYTEASIHLNMVRDRAGLEDIELTPENYMDAILHERNAELCYEGFHRLLDLRRFGMAEELLGPDGYDLGYESKDELWPFPEDFLESFKSVIQNDGY